MICPRSLVLNGTFREFSDGFEELGIPRTGSGLPSGPSAPAPPFYRSFFLSFCLSRSGSRADSIKRMFVAAKRRAERFVRDTSLVSLYLLSLCLTASFYLSFVSPFCILRSLRSSSPCTAATAAVPRFISANESFRNAPAIHPRMGTIWWMRRMHRREGRAR